MESGENKYGPSLTEIEEAESHMDPTQKAMSIGLEEGRNQAEIAGDAPYWRNEFGMILADKKEGGRFDEWKRAFVGGVKKGFSEIGQDISLLDSPQTPELFVEECGRLFDEAIKESKVEPVLLEALIEQKFKDNKEILLKSLESTSSEFSI